jgi:hypothetical protein
MEFHFFVEKDEVQLNYSQWTMRRKVFLNGKPVQRNGIGSPYELRLSNGTVKQMHVKNMSLSLFSEARLGSVLNGALWGLVNGAVWGLVWSVPYGISIELIHKKKSLLYNIAIVTGLTLLSIFISLLLSYIFQIGIFSVRP